MGGWFSAAFCEPEPKMFVKLGPWGGRTGAARDVQSPLNGRLRSVTVWSRGGAIDAISFSHAVGDEDRPVLEGPWGRQLGPSEVITLGDLEYVREIRGYTSTYSDAPQEIVRSLQIITSLRTYPANGVYGTNSGTPFSIPVVSGRIEGFFGCSGWYLDAIGVYVRP
ncbi:unnamed protein product [Alopecurus aequalis]